MQVLTKSDIKALKEHEEYKYFSQDLRDKLFDEYIAWDDPTLPFKEEDCDYLSEGFTFRDDHRYRHIPYDRDGRRTYHSRRYR